MHALSSAAPDAFASVRFVLTDMDETLTYQGRLAAETYTALQDLQAAGIVVIPVTAAPAGWCDQMARMWPVDGVIGENGGFFFRRNGHGMDRHFWHDDTGGTETTGRLAQISTQVRQSVPSARLADDQPFRLTSLAFARTGNAAEEAATVQALRQAGADATLNNLWVLGWLGGYDKLAMARRVLSDHYAVDIDTATGRDAVLYSGDSTNDAPMFSWFHHTVGVSTVRQCLDQIPDAPRWITDGPGGSGFVEAARAVLAARTG